MMIPIIDNIKDYLKPLEVQDKNGNKYLLVKKDQYICPTYCGVLHAHRIDTFIEPDTISIELLSIND